MFRFVGLVILGLLAMDVAARHIVFAANHKTGTALTARIRKGIAAACPSNDTTSEFKNRFQGPVNRRDLYIVSIRNPFLTVVSGYLYHSRGPEPWTREPIPVHPHVHGHNLLFTDRRIMVRPFRGETYEEYLKRTTMVDGLLAEMVRSTDSEFPHARYSAGLRNRTNVLLYCLDDMMQNNVEYHTHLNEILRFVNVSSACYPSVHDALHKEGPDQFHDHGTQNTQTDRIALVDAARRLDQNHFNGTIAQLELVVGCNDPRPVFESGVHVH